MTTKGISRKRLKQILELNSEQSDDRLKTAEMFRLEHQYGKPIRELLDGRLNGRRLGEKYGVSEGCISRWRKRLGIEPIHVVCKWCEKATPMGEKHCSYCRGEIR